MSAIYWRNFSGAIKSSPPTLLLSGYHFYYILKSPGPKPFQEVKKWYGKLLNKIKISSKITLRSPYEVINCKEMLFVKSGKLPKPVILLFLILSCAFSLTFSGCTFNRPAAISAALVDTVPPKPEQAPVDVPDPVKHSFQFKTADHRDDDLRKFPYPYLAMLAVASDIDGTTPEEFADYHRFINTKEPTIYGQGLGLDVGDSFWMYMGNNRKIKTGDLDQGLEDIMTYFKFLNPAQEHNADLIRHYFKAGWIDAIHTFGDFTRRNPNNVIFSRLLAVTAWNALNEAGIKPKVWINHGNSANVQNFGAYYQRDSMHYQAGDDQRSPYYHTDLTIKNGIRFVWNSIHSSQFGYDNPVFPLHLRDGQAVWGFYRYTSEEKNQQIDWIWDPGDLSRQITRENLDSLMANQQYSIIAQHLGGLNSQPLGPKQLAALQLLAEYQNRDSILTARTSRLLTYAVSRQFVQYATIRDKDKVWINIQSIADPVSGEQIPALDDIRGLTFYTDDPANTHILLNLYPIAETEIQQNPADDTGRKSITVKWFPADYTDYTGTEISS